LGPALEMILTGEPIDADQAAAWGLVNRVVPANRLLEVSCAVASSVAARGPLAVRAARAAVVAGLGTDLSVGLEQEYARFLEVVRSEDAAEGTAAFAQKRRPVYRGR